MSLFERAKRVFDAEVDALAAEYVERGTPPMEAFRRATRDVERRRADEYSRKNPPTLDELLRGRSKKGTPPQDAATTRGEGCE